MILVCECSQSIQQKWLIRFRQVSISVFGQKLAKVAHVVDQMFHSFFRHLTNAQKVGQDDDESEQMYETVRFGRTLIGAGRGGAAGIATR